MLFIEVNLYSNTALDTTGFNNRYEAKEVCYQRAKGISNSGWETDIVVKLQLLFPSEFLAGRPNRGARCSILAWTCHKPLSGQGHSCHIRHVRHSIESEYTLTYIGLIVLAECERQKALETNLVGFRCTPFASQNLLGIPRD